MAVLLLLVAIWIGWSIASQLSTPIGELIDAADKVRKGDLTVRVETSASSERDEIGVLSRSFNRMTEQLATQQEGLMEANRQLDERRRFTETVLTGVSAGVIGLDRDSRINLPNRSASDLLATKLSNHLDEDLSVVVPEMKHLLSEVTGKSDKSVQGEIRIHREGRQRTLMVSMVAEKIADEIIGYVVTFDDVTELFSAQRKAAWADVARRIAHEIKNPLTPIQLSAERLRRKYQDEIASDRKTFMICTDTIIRQVEDIGRMVDEFSAFAR
ncbi:MAG: HAMP domain-containing protein, partial [Rhodospirillales bacterium]|nr:HAMP domain-containing protein [Rhodospirillales bacterium]